MISIGGVKGFGLPCRALRTLINRSPAPVANH